MIIKKISNRITKVISGQEWYNSFWGDAIKFWNIRDFDIDVVNLGSNSGKYGFDYSSTSINGMNWALGPQSLVHDFNILKNYFSYLKTNATVIIPLCPFSSLVSVYSKQQNLKYYTFLHPATILEFDENERLKALRIKNNPLKMIPGSCIKGTVKSILKYIFFKNRDNESNNINYEENANNFISMWRKQFQIENMNASLSSRHISDQQNRVSVLRDMISFCIERDLKPVIVIPPMHQALASKFSQTFRENYIYSFVKEANEANVPFFDYMDDSRFSENKYFRNSFFLSKEGAKKFTEIFLEETGII